MRQRVNYVTPGAREEAKNTVLLYDVLCADHSKGTQISICQKNTSELKKSDKKKRGKKKAKRKSKRKKKRKKKKKEETECEITKAWRCLVRTWCIEFLFKICCCSKNLDSSSTVRPCTDPCCCCSHCKCRFCGPGSDSKYVRCDGYEESDPVASSGRESVDLHNSVNKVSSCRTKEKNKKRRKSKTPKKVESPSDETDDHFVFIPCPGKSMDASNDRVDNGTIEENTDKKTGSSTKCCSFLGATKKSRSPAKSSIKKKTMLEDINTSESMNENGCSCRRTDVKPPSTKHCKFQETKICECETNTSYENLNEGKTKKALHIMFDILFWPHTCLPKRSNAGNKKKEKIS
ncbi:uncharacterized protein [Venturia canescens]|uniref:uncharacterized protein n=1 Tax=Venturia canescens TaxID=32260 RepID=UPI001C9D4F86|nr:uncharacterized protein LOC122419081 [Venturia canescens]